METSIVSFLQSFAPHLATELTKERVTVMKELGRLQNQRNGLLSACQAALARLETVVSCPITEKEAIDLRIHLRSALAVGDETWGK